ncbi:MAG: nucleotide exchange factor GrpE [Buchnera aphidicola (Myzus persicae)]|nr:MAG: nucleotide exchange factor GrpE [Buchnera aphidicola (Myzus persicae)]
MMNKEEPVVEKEKKENKKNNQLIKTDLIRSLEDQLKKSEEKILEKKNQAEQEITKIFHRVNQELEKNRKFSLEKLLIDFLPISDSIERALNSIENNESDKIFIEIKNKLKIISDLLKDFFVFFHVKKIDDINVPFDPSIHQAMSIQYTNQIEPNKIVTIMQPGYILHESRLLRPAMVVVSKKKI